MNSEFDARKRVRIESTPEEPITVSFRQPELKEMKSRIKVRDISVNGLGLTVPLGSRAIKEGLVIEGMEIRLPGAIKCVFSGRVVYKKLGHCGVEFVDSSPAEQRKLQAFISLKEK